MAEALAPRLASLELAGQGKGGGVMSSGFVFKV